VLGLAGELLPKAASYDPAAFEERHGAASRRLIEQHSRTRAEMEAEIQLSV
jgi:hypothetical protein